MGKPLRRPNRSGSLRFETLVFKFLNKNNAGGDGGDAPVIQRLAGRREAMEAVYLVYAPWKEKSLGVLLRGHCLHRLPDWFHWEIFSNRETPDPEPASADRVPRYWSCTCRGAGLRGGSRRAFLRIGNRGKLKAAPPRLLPLPLVHWPGARVQGQRPAATPTGGSPKGPPLPWRIVGA